jgi:3'-phosphoadenosine 5'-phosphosulfate (PAPS) 3'-phosphatase
MPGGNNTSTRPVSKPGQPNPVKTVQTLLAAKKKDTRNKEPRAKRTHSEVSNDSNTSHDLSGLINTILWLKNPYRGSSFHYASLYHKNIEIHIKLTMDFA